MNNHIRSVVLPQSHYGCGDYDNWLRYESSACRREQQQDMEARFCPPDCALNPELYSVVDGVVCNADGSPFRVPDWEALKMEAAQRDFREDRKRLGDLISLYSLLEG